MLTFTLGKLLCLLRKFKSVSTHTLDKTRNVSVISHLSANHVPSLTASIIYYIQNSHISQQFLPWCVISFTAEIMSLHISRKNMHYNLLSNLTCKRWEFIIFYCTITTCPCNSDIHVTQMKLMATINSLSPSIHIQILQTGLHTFP